MSSDDVLQVQLDVVPEVILGWSMLVAGLVSFVLSAGKQLKIS